MPAFLTAEAVSEGRLRIVCEDFPTDDAMIYALHRIEVREVARITALLRYLKDVYAAPAAEAPRPKAASRKRGRAR